MFHSEHRHRRSNAQADWTAIPLAQVARRSVAKCARPLSSHCLLVAELMDMVALDHKPKKKYVESEADEWSLADHRPASAGESKQ